MILILVLALFLPQIIFYIQDKYQMNNTQVQTRGNLDIAQLNLTYEQDLNTRMLQYLRLSNKTATAIDYENSESDEQKELVFSILQEPWFEPFSYIEYLNKSDYDAVEGLNISDARKYLIHGADYQAGVVLMMWYIELDWIPFDTRIRLLVDAQTHTIYYVRVLTDNAIIKNKKENLYFLLEMISSYYDFYYTYYEPDKGVFVTEEGLTSEYYVESNASTMKDEQVWFMDAMLEEKQCEISFCLPYGELLADFVFEVQYKDVEYADIKMGIPIIGEMIPEMIQD
uniref:hypothetical protein n=1 Tax=Acetatifactor sp. TaxID=1872090 RepID=UPI004057C6A5